MAENELYKKALAQMMSLCSSREYCRVDIMAKLENKQLKDNDIEKIIAQLEKERFIDEERYAKAFASDKFRYNDWGKIKIAAQLKAKHISGKHIMVALSAIDEKEYLEKIQKLLTAKRKTVKAKNQYDLLGKLFRYGQSKGFESELLYRFINLPEEG
jgi:regulatory protein